VTQPDAAPRQRLGAALRIIPGERLSPPGKLVLSAEVVLTYLRVRWWMRRQRIEDVVAATRATEVLRPANVEPGSLDARLIGGRLANAVDRTLRLLPTDSRCLVQALTLSRLLAVRGVDSTVVIGAESAPNFEAHAWLEHRGFALQSPEQFGDSRLAEI
jgi:hypothetical protein